MNATPHELRRLLDLADIDRRLRQAENARRNPPQAARLQELVAQRTVQSHELAVRAGVRDDLQTEVGKIESDVRLAAERRDRDHERLATAATAKDAQALEREIDSLGQRLRTLEDSQLELMEKLEDAEAAVTEQERLLAATAEEGQSLSAQGKRIVADAERDLDALGRDRKAVSSDLTEALLSAYDRLDRRGIVAAAKLVGGGCEGCHVMLSPSDLAQVTKAPLDAIVNCPECECILVREKALA